MVNSRVELAREYGTHTMSMMVTPTLGWYWREHRLMGNYLDTNWLTLYLYDDEGSTYQFMRAMQKNTSAKVFMRKTAADGTVSVIGPRYTGYMWYAYNEAGDGIVMRSYDDDPNTTFRLDIKPQHYHYVDNDDIDVEIEVLGPGNCFAVLGNPDGLDETVTYWEERGRVTGTVCGKPVTGYSFYDRCYLQGNKAWHQAKQYLAVHEMDVPFVTEYEDGSVIYGDFKKGVDDFAVGYVVIDGKVYHDDHYKIDITWNEETQHFKYVDFECAGMKLRYNVEFDMPDPEATRSTIAHLAGSVTIVGDDRKVVRSIGWSECRPKFALEEAAGTS